MTRDFRVLVEVIPQFARIFLYKLFRRETGSIANFGGIAFFCCAVTALTYASAQETAAGKEKPLATPQEYYTLGKKLLEENKYPEADEAFKKAQELLQGISSADISPNPPAEVSAVTQPKLTVSQQALKASQEGKPEEAIDLYLRAIDAAPKNPDLRYNLAVEYLKTKQFKKAAEMFQRVLLLNPRDKNAYYNLGVLCESYFQDKSRALLYYSRYLKFADASRDNTLEAKEWVRQLKKELKAQ